MRIEYEGALEIKGNLLFFETVENVGLNEEVAIRSNEKILKGIVSSINEQITVIEILGEVYELDLQNIKVEFKYKPVQIPLSEEMSGKVLNSFGEILDKSIVNVEKYQNINVGAYNPAKRLYPKDIVKTGFSSIDALNTLIKGQKLPIFALSGLPNDEFVAKLATQIEIENSVVILGAIGLRHERAEFLIDNIVKNNQNVTVFLNLANEPAVNSLVLPRSALTFAEYMAFEKGKNVIVILYDMTNYANALREISAKKEEIPGKKGYPGYMYSDLASIYERAGILKGKEGSITQIPILTLPDDDITHPIPDLTGYITEGQITMDRNLYKKGIFPPVNVLTSLSRLMNSAIDKTHKRFASQLYSSYAKAKKIEMFASIIGEEELSETEKKYLLFSKKFEKEFINQDIGRTFEETFNKGWELLKILPESELIRLTDEEIKKYING
ncbi:MULTISPECIES: V-type ATP synthase subunit B [unclassified Lebetimonas]|uniref:V-type ATP synthase subunit B n=1 Tax=unclassified Lebetimonas TaxID=2648158 RepID=UPI00046454A3|nr:MULTISPECIES: V-type ATP synthase subunit B [unclassified Lebetimonas]